MTIYTVVISWAGSFDDDMDSIFLTKEAAIHYAKELIADDEHNVYQHDYKIDWVCINTMVPGKKGLYRTIKTERITHKLHKTK